MILVNGERTKVIDVTDRGFQYGDGVFETLKIRHAKADFWNQHMARLSDGCRRLGLPEPEFDHLREEARQVMHNVDLGVLKIILSRGIGPRGYRPTGAAKITRIVAQYPFPSHPTHVATHGVGARFCTTMLSCHPQLAGVKHLNRLEQVMAAAEWDDPAIVDGIMCDQDGYVIEGTMTNLFLVKKGGILTPDLTRCGIAGIMRGFVLQLAEELQISVHTCRLRQEDVLAADEVFLTNSLIGVWPVTRLDNKRFSVGPVVRQLMKGLTKYETGE